ncbi:MAG: DHH family phosphoesterase, partial [Candidatus Pacearchaeota archaeon]|nr:DHH family phosphoesterase [Candidatus Pacearchaeota archaeon]
KGIKIFPSTRAIHKALEFGSNVFIPGVTGTSEGALAFLEELEIEVRDKSRKSYRTLLDLSKEELSKLITALTLKINLKTEELIGNVYLIKIFGRLYDARELSAMINACGRLGHGSIALAFLFNSKDAREKVERVYSEYKHHLIDGLNFVAFAKKREGNNYIIIDAENKIKDTIIGSVMSIIANSFVYPDGTILVGIADREEKAKISMRICGKNVNSVNLYSLLNSVVQLVGGECGGHKNAAGALIPKKKKEEFKSLLEKALQIGEIKIKI